MRNLDSIIGYGALGRKLTGTLRGLSPSLLVLLAVACGDSTAPASRPEPRPSHTVAHVEVSPAEHLLEVGQTVRLVATPRSAAGDTIRGRVATWALVGESSVARVDASGVLTATGEGVALATATVDGKAGSAAITVRAAGAPSPAPLLAAIAPNSATAGAAMVQTMTVVGQGFVPASNVRWNDETLATHYVSATELRATIEQRHIAHAGEIAVTVFTPAPGGGISASATFSVRPADAPAPAPVITAMSPRQIPAGWLGNFTLTVTGAGFTQRSTIVWNGHARETFHVNAGELRTTISQSEVAEADTVAVAVHTPAPGGGLSDAQEFRILLRPIVRIELASAAEASWTWLGVPLAMKATPYDILGTPTLAWGVSWSSGNEAVARVSDAGIVTPVARGVAAIRATSGGVTVERHLRVLDAPDHALLYDANFNGVRRVVLWAPGSNPILLTGGSRHAYDPSPSPDGSRIALTAIDAEGNSDIWVIDRNGTNGRRLTTHAWYDGQPAWSPDGSRIAFASSRDGYTDIFVMNADGSDQRRLTWEPGDQYRFDHQYNLHPEWTPDSRQIVFTSTGTGGQHVWVMNADGGAKRQLTTGETSDSDPGVSADGQRVTFRRETQNGAFMLTVTLSDGVPVWTIGMPGPGRAPSYSPDGKWLVYQGAEMDTAALYVQPADLSSAPRVAVPREVRGGMNGAWIRKP